MDAAAISSSLKPSITFPANKKALVTARKKRDTIRFSDQYPNSKSSAGQYPSPTGITINGRRLKTRSKILAIDDHGVSAAADIARGEVTWQIIVGAIAGVTPFVVAGIEFSKENNSTTKMSRMWGIWTCFNRQGLLSLPRMWRVSTMADMEKILLWASRSFQK
ncbi:hypothetical protein OIU77_025677 [Salix suchowensis]|uniref:Uncharacterized protein n=1 Tax=Salix suchowensis TaxID=1278906 RepID=A0ABQ9C046_9ROSI|nr:hypothetical protein OIU77_025677 [Salix suchowensis]